jgi:hypothetical protein
MFEVEYSIEILIDSYRVTINFSEVVGFKKEIPKIFHVWTRLLEEYLFLAEIINCFIPTPNEMIMLFGFGFYNIFT